VARETRRFLEELASDAAIDIHLVEARAKTLESYTEKSTRTNKDGSPKYTGPADQIHDCVAARLITYTIRTRDLLASLIEDLCILREPRHNPGEGTHNGYDSEHLVICGIKDSATRGHFGKLAKYLDKYQGLEIQVRSVAGHAWAEYEHDTRYKSGNYNALTDDDKKRVGRYFAEAGGMRRYMDKIFDEIEELLRPQDVGPIGDPVQGIDEPSTQPFDPTPLSAETLNEFIANRFPNDEPGEASYLAALASQLSGLNIATVGQLDAALSVLEEGQVARLMDYPNKPNRIRKIDDELLHVFQDRYVDATDDLDRRRLLRLRLRRVRGRFTIYSLEGLDGTLPVAAARAVRNLAKFVAERIGIERTTITGVIGANQSDVTPGWIPKEVETSVGSIYVATNLNRAHAEELMADLVSRVPGSGVQVRRAGDLLFPAPLIPEETANLKSPGLDLGDAV
jgi:ppGpp synthetase/RelA/SpoT-type nucleotidyltranferase